MKAVLAIVGDNLDPALVSATLGGEPRKSGKKGEPIVHGHPVEFAIGKAINVRPGKDVCLISTGNTLAVAVRAAEELGNDANAWRQLSTQFRTEVAVHGVPRRTKSEGVFSGATLSLLRERGLQLCLHEK